MDNNKVKKTVAGGVAAILVFIAGLFLNGEKVDVYQGHWTLTQKTDVSSLLEIKVPDEAHIDYWQIVVNDATIGEISMLNQGIMSIPVIFQPIHKVQVALYRGLEVVGAGKLKEDGTMDIRVKKEAEVKAANAKNVVVMNQNGLISVFGSVNEPGKRQITILLHDKELPFPQGIRYINQTETAESGSFLFRFRLSNQYLGKSYILKIGGEGFESAYEQEIAIEKYRARKDEIEDNSIMIGRDVYNLASSALTPENIIQSMQNGGNILNFKMGGKWYNVYLANNSGYFVPANAIPDNVVSSWQLGKWYPLATNESFEFEN